MNIIGASIKPDSTVYTDSYSYRSYNALAVSVSVDRATHSEKFVAKNSHISGIENFWKQAKRPMRKFNGIPKQHFSL